MIIITGWTDCSDESQEIPSVNIPSVINKLLEQAVEPHVSPYLNIAYTIHGVLV